METNMEKKHIGLIAEGTVIDHISNDDVFKLIRILKIDFHQALVFVGFNLESSKIGKKGLIKIENVALDDETLHKIALLAPSVTINIIKNYRVVEKKKLVLAEQFFGIIKCSNYNCITNKENVETRFVVEDTQKRLFRCYFCETFVHDREVQIIKQEKSCG